MESLALTVPQVTPAVTLSEFSVAAMYLIARPAGQAAVSVHLIGTNGERLEVRTDTAAEAITLLSQLNNANLSIKSLQRRCLEWCATKRAALAGAVAGTPD